MKKCLFVLPLVTLLVSCNNVNLYASKEDLHQKINDMKQKLVTVKESDTTIQFNLSNSYKEDGILKSESYNGYIFSFEDKIQLEYNHKIIGDKIEEYEIVELIQPTEDQFFYHYVKLLDKSSDVLWKSCQLVDFITQYDKIILENNNTIGLTTSALNYLFNIDDFVKIGIKSDEKQGATNIRYYTNTVTPEYQYNRTYNAQYLNDVFYGSSFYATKSGKSVSTGKQFQIETSTNYQIVSSQNIKPTEVNIFDSDDSVVVNIFLYQQLVQNYFLKSPLL